MDSRLVVKIIVERSWMAKGEPKAESQEDR